MVLMVKDNEQDAVERERILSAKKTKSKDTERNADLGSSCTEGDNAVEESFFTCHSDQYTSKSRPLADTEEEGSSIEIHHHVEPVVEGGDEESWMRIQSPPAETPSVSSGKRDFPIPSHGAISKDQREAKVEDVIRRHTIRRAREMKELLEREDNSAPVGGEERIRKTPVKKKGRKRRGKKKGSKFMPKFLGQLFSSSSSPIGTPSPSHNAQQVVQRVGLPPVAKPNADFCEDNTRKPLYAFQRPPVLSIGGVTNGRPGSHHYRSISQERCLSPLMVTSPGLSCGGLLDEEFAMAMRDAEKMEQQAEECEVSFNNDENTNTSDGSEAVIPMSTRSRGVPRMDSYMSPRITSSPREIQSVKTSEGDPPVKNIVDDSYPLESCMEKGDGPSQVDRKDTIAESNTTERGYHIPTEEKGAHAKMTVTKALFPEDEELERLKKQSLETHLQEPMIPLRVHEQEISKLEKKYAATIDHLTQQHGQHIQELKNDLEGQITNALRQKEVVEATSTSLANQLALLYSRVKIAEKKANEAIQELQLQKSSSQLRSSTCDRLNEEIQHLSRENTRLIREKTSMEHHTRQLTSILHTIMSAETSAKQNEELMWNALQQSTTDDDAQKNTYGEVDEMVKYLSATTHKELTTDTARDQCAPGSTDHRRPLTTSNMAEQPPAGQPKQKPAEDKQALDKQLLELNMEKEKLDMELSHMPATSAGRTVAQRRRRRLVENRLEDVQREISKVKRELRKIKAI